MTNPEVPLPDDITMDDCIFKIDGNMICCHLPDFTNLMESPAGFGFDHIEAYKDFLEQWENGL